MKAKKSKDNTTQKDKFIIAARSLGCDESEPAFNAKLKKLAKPKKSAKRGKK